METNTNNTQTLESQPLSNQVAVSSPSEIDIAQLVQTCAKRKASFGETFTGRKSKQSLFSLVCAMYKNLSGMEKFDKDGRPTRVNSETETKIHQAIEDFWKLQSNRFLSYGEITNVSFDKPLVIFDKEMRVTDVKLRATMTAQRDAKDLAERALTVYERKRVATKRMEYMQIHNAKYNREQLQTQQAVILGLEAEIARINVVRETDKNKAIFGK